MKSKTFCILPWIHLSTRPDGALRLCCTANASSVSKTTDTVHKGQVGVLKLDNGKPANLNTTNLNDAWNNSFMMSTRKTILEGNIPASCAKCFEEEKNGHRSKRNWETEKWIKEGINVDDLIQNTTKDGFYEGGLPYIDLRLGSKCNLRCVMCSPHDSSDWVDDWDAIYPQVENSELKQNMVWDARGLTNGASYDWFKNNTEFWDQLYDKIPTMKQLYFAGGEPLIIKEHYQLLERCIDMGYAKNIVLRYNSNGLKFPPKLFKLWSQFKKVRFHFSIDDIEDRNHYIRYPSKWDIITKNLHFLDNNSPDNTEVTIACAVQALNVMYIPDLVKWKLEQKFKKINTFPNGAGLVNWHFVYHPAHLNVRVLPQHLKDSIEHKYNEFYKWLESNWELSGAPSKEAFMNDAYGIKRMQGIIKFMQGDDWSRRLPQLREYLYLIDKRRNLQFASVFPELSSLVGNNILVQNI